MHAEERFDDYTWSEHKKIITFDKHHIPGLANISHMMLSNVDNTSIHYHSDIIEIHCIVKGQRTLQITDEGKTRKYTAKGNELTITHPFEMHETENRDKNRNEFYAIQLSLRAHNSYLGLSEGTAFLLRQEILNLPHRHLKIGQSHLSLLRTAFNLLAYGDASDKPSAVSYLVCFLFGLKYLKPVFQPEQHDTVSPLQNTIKYISEHIDQQISLQDLATVSGYSLSHFKYMFKEHYGITPAEYITLQKINTAEKELLTSDISITDLAYKLSFSSSNYFCTVFKKVLGCSPSEYRKLYRD